ncbi:bifunctional (p)ppGpp synthetase/guanosine-3',5'-bis(diphosphate) 3'-pyrophosphohydrolase [Pontibacter sp. BT310]|uniref:Bifunctional (P)ppGpp synthetase/guanosine-3',5'-bis(Diphosphate) 3'-pyrophosphohydrolase n=2 Tax=Hymenobacteraceae TaxID=1853232 RepID=A0ABS6XDU3_9BACT|nr:bifunctional (p)ppGpp synthetase/guanosine-3',5'-bis(diphosphate) 3'-pyrophosphohydrolase [Pontibacter populi]MBJ6119304.1 bifunctional (p)ppGpp synthetase/guanosine-3',5'-bis(diphosphate) 3'-pyrophosphohydrolase [Pontibacter sp. BT310]MBW3366158.1 bifunctional (p)ppGpp synthetase/guanosine-3',5'-bis(diphosphate) 3'-pyrophosphohydrolase [Pontibacter populi]
MTMIDPEAERKEILRLYRRLLRHAKPFLRDNDAKIIKKAFNTSVEAHKDMRRKSGEPYIYHPIAVAQIAVEEIGLGTTSIVAALLHDVVEDTEMEIEDVERDFGPSVARIIEGLTKISGVFDYGTSQQAENFRKMLLTLSDDVRVILIKLADRLHNMRTLDSMPRHKQLKIASETMYLYAPLAHRLGLYAIKSELEDLYLKYTDTATYKDISNKIRQTRAARSKFIKDFIAPIEEELDKHGFKFNIKGRPKSIYSILKKIKKQNITFEEVYDLFAIRITLDVPFENEKAACWQVYSIITDFYQPNPDRLRDWVNTPKANGYESLHTTVMSKSGQWVEVQIRTKRMDEIAERGYAAHWKYKDGAGNESGLEQWINKVRDMLENNTGNALEFMDEFRKNLFVEEVFVFTPKGELIILPDKATALDFAFEIHSQIGLQCLGAKVNQKLVPLSYRLYNGDQVEILTSQKQKPNEEWLNYAVTSKARSRIKEALREERKHKTEQGKVLLDKRLAQLKVADNQANMNKLMAFFNVPSVQDLYYRLATGHIDTKNIKEVIFTATAEKGSSTLDPKSFDREVQKIRGVNSDMLVIGENTSNMNYKIAGCCNPIPGDDVFGFETGDEDIEIHRTNCQRAIELMSNYGNRVVRAKWTDQKELAFLAGIRIKGTDRVGLVNDLTRIISNSLRVNMRSITIDSHDGIFEGNIMVFVNDTGHLDKLMQRMGKVNGILTVERFD